jgi:hypothetical protein
VDFLIFLFYVIFMVVFALLPFIIETRSRVLAIFPLFGGLAGLSGANGLLVDGDLTTGTSTVIATSGATNTFIWNGVALFMLLIVLSDFLTVIYVVLHK